MTARKAPRKAKPLEQGRYAIVGGKAGYDRLLVLARSRWRDTSALLERAGISEGMKCVDVGCGGGEVSLNLAERVGPNGFVVGIDMDAVKLELGRAAAKKRGLANVEFRVLPVQDWAERAAYDLVYSRALLHHLSAPVPLLRRMWAAVRAGGRLVVEDADHDGWAAYPQNDGFDFHVRMLSGVIDRRGGDHSAGRKLVRHCLDAGIPSPEVSLVESVNFQGEAKEMPLLTLGAIASAIESEGLASRAEIEAATDSLERFTRDPTTLISGPRMYQVIAHRARAG
jgi:SAM-dependent methyltransferase